MAEIGWLIVGAALIYGLVKYGFKWIVLYREEAQKERMRRALDWDNSYRRERHRKRALAQKTLWQRMGLSD